MLNGAAQWSRSRLAEQLDAQWSGITGNAADLRTRVVSQWGDSCRVEVSSLLSIEASGQQSKCPPARDTPSKDSLTRGDRNL